MARSSQQLRHDAIRIWRAGVEAVDSERLVLQNLSVEGSTLMVGRQSISLDTVGRIGVVGAGKAGAGMAAAVEKSLGTDWLASKEVVGWVNVPDDCVRPLDHIWLHGARPAGLNEPTAAGVFGSGEMLRIVESLGSNDLCLCLLSGGGSALMPAPDDPVTLADKLAITRHLSEAGATIEQLNTVRKQLSRLKGGGLARKCQAGRLITLIISDVPGDPIDVIASGPTVPDSSTAKDALDILETFEAEKGGISPAVFEYLQRKKWVEYSPPAYQVTNLVIGNNAMAVEAAAATAVKLGYRPSTECAVRPEGPAEQVGCRLAEVALKFRETTGPDCLISGGEPVVTLVDAQRRGRGGRNQQLVLAALTRLEKDGCVRIALLSAGTDGEDGPTDAAGAVIDQSILKGAEQKNLDAADYLVRDDAYRFFDPLGALVKTGPTHTNVCDLRVVLVDRPAEVSSEA